MTAEPKSPLASRTIIGALVVMLSQIARWLWPEVEIDVSATVDAVTSLLAIAGAGLAWWGRLKAERPIRWRAVPTSGAGADPDAGDDRAVERLRELPPNHYGPAARSGAGDRAHDGDEFWGASGGPFLGGD